MADGLDLIDIYAEEEFIQESEFAAEQVDLYDDVLAATVAPSDGQQGARRVSQSPASHSMSSSTQAPGGDSLMAKSNNQSMAAGLGMRKARSSVYVGNFAWWTTDQHLETIIRSVGVRDLIELKFAENRANGQSKGYAEIVVGSESSASKLITSLANRKVHGDSLDVRLANKQNLSFFEAMSRKRIPPRAKDSTDGVSQHVEKPAATPSVDRPPSVVHYFSRPPFMDPPRVPVMNVPHMMNIPPPVPPRAPPPPVPTGFRGPMPPPGLQYQQMMAPPPRLPPHMTGPPPGTVPPALHLNPAFFPPPNTALAPPPNPFDKGPPNPYANRPPNAFNNHPPNPYNRPPNPSPPNPYGKVNTSMYDKVPPNPYGKMMNNPYMHGSKEMGLHRPGMSEEQFEEIMNRNRAISSSAISKALSGASSGEYNNAAKTLQTAIAVIKESRVANDARCRVLLSSLKDCLRGIETKSGPSSRKRHRSRERSTSRSRESRSGSRRHRDGLHSEERQEEYYERHRERDRHH